MTALTYRDLVESAEGQAGLMSAKAAALAALQGAGLAYDPPCDFVEFMVRDTASHVVSHRVLAARVAGANANGWIWTDVAGAVHRGPWLSLLRSLSAGTLCPAAAGTAAATTKPLT